VQPAPAETPQSRKAARVGGRSGVTQVAYPLFFYKKRKINWVKSFADSKINAFLCAAEFENSTRSK